MTKIIDFIKEYKTLSAVILMAIMSFILSFIFDQAKIANYLLAVTTIIVTIPMFISMIKDIASGRYGIDILAITAISASVYLGEYWAGIVLVLMMTGGAALENYAEHRAKRELTMLMDRAPRTANLKLDNGEIKKVKVSTLKLDDILIVKPGEVVPVDVVIVSGKTRVDESSITGESLPIDKIKNDELLSGSVNTDGLITVRVLRLSKDSQYQKIVDLVKQAASSEAPFVRLADKYSIYFTIISFVIAFSAWGLSGDPLRFLQVLVVATPCPFLLGAPIALISGMSRSAKHSIIIKTGATLEKLATIKSIAFDKTGTLTVGHPSLDKTVLINDKYKADDLLRYAASLEQNSSHVLALAIVNAAKNKKLKLDEVSNLKETAGNGLVGKINSDTVILGKFTFLKHKDVIVPKNFNVDKVNQTASFISINGHLVGYFLYIDEVRPESKMTIQKLRKLGIKHMTMLTGDNQSTAKLIAEKVGIHDYRYDCLPEDKLNAVKNTPTKYRPTLMVGDGINDAPVLVAADVGLAMGARGASVASESADGVIMVEDISKVQESIYIAKRTIFIAKQSIAIGVIISIILMLVFATGKFSPTLGAALQEVVDVAVIINALRAYGSFKNSSIKK